MEFLGVETALKNAVDTGIDFNHAASSVEIFIKEKLAHKKLSAKEIAVLLAELIKTCAQKGTSE